MLLEVWHHLSTGEINPIVIQVLEFGLSLLTLWLIWRVWTFTLLPKLKPAEPQEVPYWIPFLGHAIGFFKDTQATLAYGREYFHNTEELYAMTVAGEKLYIVTSPQDMGAVYKNTSTLTFDGFIQDLDHAFEMSSDGFQKMWQRRSEHNEKSALPISSCLAHLGSEIHKLQLHPGKHLDDITDRFIAYIEQGTLWEGIPSASVTLVTVDSKIVSLYNWCAEVLINAATRTLYGDSLPQLEPNLLQGFLRFDANSWMLTYRYPYFLAKSMHAARRRLTETFIRYFDIPLNKRPESCYYIRTWEAHQREAGMNSRDIAIVSQLFHWVTNANAFKICFWLISYIVFEPGLLKSIQAETEFGIINGKVEIAHLLNHCPYLDAAFHETLRLTSNASSARTILAPTTVSKKVLQPGCKLLIPYRQLHFNPAVFGAEVKKFNAQRFLDNDALSRSTNYRPFGGGSTYCSGRFIARREVYAFVALVLNRFELTLQDPKQCFPRLDETTPSLGVIGPLSGHDLILNIKRRI